MLLDKLSRLTMITVRRRSVFALSSGPPPSAISIVRITGPQSMDALQKLTGKTKFEPKVMKYSHFYDSEGNMIDKGMAVFFKGPNSFTGEDTVELFLHGSRAVIDAMLHRLSEMKNMEPSAAGEFTKRAFYNAKMDVAQVEALKDLIEAQTAPQLRLAHRQHEVSQVLQPIRSELIDLSARLEATIDFGEDVEGQQGSSWRSDIVEKVEVLLKKLKDLEKNAHKGILVRDGIKVAIVGKTNVGKSSLLNLLAERDVAIVSDIPGTTRDSLELKIRLAQLNVTLFDTAGHRRTEDPLELEGIRRSSLRINESHLALIVVSPETRGLSENLTQDISHFLSMIPPTSKKIIVINKSDLLTENEMENIRKGFKEENVRFISCLDKSGIDGLLKSLESEVRDLYGTDENEIVLSRERHVHLLRQSIEVLKEFEDALEMDSALAAEILRQASDSVGEITGAIVNEAVLDRIFSTFCVGK